MTTLIEHISQFFKDNCAEDIFFDGYGSLDGEEYTIDDELSVSPFQYFAELGILHNIVKSHGGEGKGDEYYKVHKFTLGDESVFIMFSGFYQSYHGSEYQEMSIVEPREVTVTEYLHAGSL